MEWVANFDDKFCIAILGDFLGGLGDSSPEEHVSWIPARATPDSVMKLAGFRPRIRVGEASGEDRVEVVFDSLQSFDPGELFKNLDIFGPLREAREAAKSGQPLAGQPSPPSPESSEPDPAGGPDLLDAILDVSQPPPTDTAPGTREEIEAFVRDVVRPHLVGDDTDVKARIASVDQSASQEVSKLLHDERFKRIETIWRSVVFLLSRIDTTGKARVHLVHLPKEVLRKDLDSDTDLEQSRLGDLLSSSQLGAPETRWGLVVGAYDFSVESDDIDLLGRIAKVAQRADVPWVSGITAPRNEGHPSLDPDLDVPLPILPKEWHQLRERPEAAWLGITYPRFLLREPFGGAQRRVRAFDFQETLEGPGNFLWGNGSFLIAALMAEGVVSEGWGVRPDNHLDIGGIPLGTLPQGQTPSSVEHSLRPGDARTLIENGIIPLLGFPERAAIRVGGIHSVSDPPSRLAAWWAG